eukprot:CAMPEP_0174350386 /NCGR_PEP_ID=MMETSP0811_2-20130205/7451_1 /TAXON_ID=73025 ORGANISM="Eutreptiella gymnastica-like, Strain CCMP1594" /NCGR_SAMPLE_ID=MMETSP0811_2 /ASSEMBLY_ACC=CAM_ASM_000667 /LENGTH=133 /DNA_ID=CAMNT_0015478639 /DNA_START=88 /DNA_END=489 /DNA_ORIENTATION=-
MSIRSPGGTHSCCDRPGANSTRMRASFVTQALPCPPRLNACEGSSPGCWHSGTLARPSWGIGSNISSFMGHLMQFCLWQGTPVLWEKGNWNALADWGQCHQTLREGQHGACTTAPVSCVPLHSFHGSDSRPLS